MVSPQALQNTYLGSFGRRMGEWFHPLLASHPPIATRNSASALSARSRSSATACRISSGAGAEGQGGASVPLFYRITQKGKASPCTGVTFATPDVVSFIRPFPEPCLGWPPAERTRQQFRCCGHGLAFLCLRAAFTLARFLGSGDLGWCGQ